MRHRHYRPTRLLALLSVLFALLCTHAALAGPPKSGSGGTSTTTTTTTYSAFMTKSLTSKVNSSPSALYRVIVKGKKGVSTGSVASDESSVISTDPATGSMIRKQYSVINGTASTLSGKQIQKLAAKTRIASITEDVKMRAVGLSNPQLWPAVSQVSSFWSSSLSAPSIAIVDSGVDVSRVADFGGRVIEQQTLVNGNVANTRDGDGYGHGTFVASIAAGSAVGYTGATPGANIVSIDVLDDAGMGDTSDVIDAAEFIFKNKDRLGIKVANFSLCAGSNSSFMYDPLDHAVEKLWLNGVVVITAAGNYAVNGQASGVVYAPGNDPFVITVGAADLQGTASTTDDFNAPWSAYGYTADGFFKPELGAPGRSMNAAAPLASAMYTQHPERIVAPGYMWMSGTSFAAPVVSGAAAQILAAHPDWTPDQVKGALMLAAAPTAATGNALGVGELRASDAAAVSNPPNPNAGLNQYVVSDGSGSRTFDAASWSSAAQANASWNSASWNSASWSSASWSSASWSSASWSSASWASASWASGQTTDTSLPSASWASLTWVS
jgi:serine protease AprX